MADLYTRVSDYVWKDLMEKQVNGRQEQMWESLRKTGTEVWLDTADIAEAETIWTSEFSAFTTNSSQLNNEIQKGTYDVYIFESKSVIRELAQEDRVREINFILNARHSLRLARKFRCNVNIELHTGIAHDIKLIVNYGKRYHDICPEHFVIKIPYTAEGLIAARMLRDEGVKTNINLGFSPRMNILAIRLARPDFVNVFLGRIGEFFVENKLGTGNFGEYATVASQNWVTGISAENEWPTRQISASLRSPAQIDLLAGCDIITIPPKVAAEAQSKLSKKFKSRMHENYEIAITDEAKTAHLEKLWKVDPKILKLTSRLASKVPASAPELIHIAHEEGCEDLFPYLSKEERAALASDGRIPVYSRWEKKMEEGKIAPDSLLSIAGLASFDADQRMLDDRIRNIIET